MQLLPFPEWCVNTGTGRRKLIDTIMCERGEQNSHSPSGKEATNSEPDGGQINESSF